jgi:hypothetical protein
MNGSWSNSDAIRAFADDMDSAWVDQVAIQLLEAAEYSAGGLSAALQSLADSLASEVKNRMEIYNEREKPRRTLVFMTGITTVTLVGIIFFSHTDQLSGYRTPVGSALLAVIVAIFVGLLLWSKRITRSKPEPRILINDGQGEVS